jgi:hypothetical protein
MSDVRFLAAPGSRFTLIDRPGQTYPGISWADIARLVANPQAKEKQDADFFIPSTYREHDGRAHDAQRERGAYRMLALDIDRGNPSLDDVLAAVEAICGPVSLLAYSSSGASPENRKWRVLIPVMGVLTGPEYELAQTALFDLMHLNGIHPDGALARCGQPIYLPNVPLDKRNPDLSPIFYEQRIIRAKTLRIDDSPIRQEIDRRLEQYRLAAEQAQIASRERERQRAERRQKFPDQVSPVDAFNADHDIGDLLLRYQYERQGASKHYRSRYQTSPSYATQDFGDHWVSMSGSDAAAGVGRPKSLGESAYCWGDAFDLFVHYEHGGDFDAAVRAYGAEINPVAAAANDVPENGLDDFEYIAPQATQEAPASDDNEFLDLDAFDTPDAPTAAPDWPTLFDAFDEASIPVRRWIYGTSYLRKFTSMLAAAGSSGKTSEQTAEGIAIATGKPLLGEPVHEQCNVWFINLEDPMEEMQRRILATMKYYGVTPDEVRGKLFLNAGREFSMKFGTQTKDGLIPNKALVEYMIQKIREKNIGMVYIDPFVGCHNANESDNVAMNAIVAEIRKVADETDCAICLVHHTRKANGESVDVDSVRGASSLIGAVRSARVINRMTEDEAVRLGIDPSEAKSIMRLDDAKANLAPPASAAVYRKMVGVQIANGEWVGVCTPYKLPDAFDGVSGKDARTIQRIVANALEDGDPYRESVQSKRWVGIAVADLLDIDITEKAGKTKVSSIVKTWLKTGVLAIERVTDPRQGREVAVVVQGDWISHDEV